jgi:hypothetical protein
LIFADNAEGLLLSLKRHRKPADLSHCNERKRVIVPRQPELALRTIGPAAM